MGAADKAVKEAVQAAVKANIHQRMLAVMREVSYVQKEDKRVNNQYTFVSHDAVTAKIRPHLVSNGIIAIVRVVSHKQDGNRTEVDVEVDFINADEPTDRVTVPAFGYGIDPSDKGPGKAISYATKYAYLKAFALETGDDPERDMIDHSPAIISDEQWEELDALMQATNTNQADFAKYLKVPDVTNLLASDFERAKEALESKQKVLNKGKSNGQPAKNA